MSKMPAENESSRHIVIRSNSGFEQQGQIDWTLLAKNSVDFSVDALSRLSSAGVDALTIYAARAMFRQVRLDWIGEQRVIDALKACRAFSSYNNTLWFGFGVKHLVRNLAESQQGIACIGFCSCLTEEFSASTASKILREVFMLYKPPVELSPSLSQWHTLVKACEGIFASTNFGIILSQLSRICLTSTRRHLRTNSSPEDVANVLKGLFDISTGVIGMIHISGGADCAWLATVAHWLLGLRVAVQDATGNVVYRPGNLNTDSTDDDQVIIWYSAADSRTTSVLASKCYFVPSGRFLVQGREKESEVLSHGRLDWSTCLCDAFGRNMELLLTSHALQTGTALGSAARIYEHIACDSEGAFLSPSYHMMARASLSGPKSFGRAFILQARDRFPELQKSTVLFHMMEKAQRSSIEDALREFSQSINSLVSLCNCGVCTLKHGPGDVENSDEPFCMVALIYTICEFIRLTSRIIFQDGLSINPTLVGVDRLYSEQTLQGNRELPFDPVISLSTRRDLQFYDTIDQAQILFTGRSDKDGIHDTKYSAIASDGLCIYSKNLCEIPSECDSAYLAYVVPGRIEWNGTLHDQVQEAVRSGRRYPSQVATGSVWYNDNASEITTYDNLNDSTSPDLEATLIIEEQLNHGRSLGTKWRISSSKGFCFLSSRLESYLPEKAYCKKICPREGCGSLNGYKSILLEGDGFINYDKVCKNDGSPIYGPFIRVLSGNHLAIWLALANAFFPGDRNVIVEPFLRERQCVRCCIINAMKQSPGGGNVRIPMVIVCIL